MFYVKEQISDVIDVFIETNDENVFCKCLYCGTGVQVEIPKILQDGESDLFGTTVLCEDCSRKLMEETSMGIRRFNSEGYFDPTTYETLTNIHKQEKTTDKTVNFCLSETY